MAYGGGGFVRFARRLAALSLIALAAFLLINRRSVVGDIIIFGNSRFPEERIIGLSGVETGMDMRSLDAGAIAASVERDPYFQVEGVEFRGGDTVVITVRESAPRALVSCMGVNLLIDGQCRMLKNANQTEPAEVLTVTGMEIASWKEGARIESLSPYQTESLELVLGAIAERGVTGALTELNLSNQYGIYLMTDTGVQILLGDAEGLARKIMVFEACYARMLDEGMRGGVLDISSGKNGYYRAS